MTPLAHAIFAFILGTLLKQFGIEPAIFALLALLVDIDIFYSKNHRNDSWLHFPNFWLIAFIPLSFFVSPFYLLAPLSHLVLDSIDYGVAWLWPLNRRLYGLHWNKLENILETPIKRIFGSYLRNKKMMLLELIIFLIGIIILQIYY